MIKKTHLSSIALTVGYLACTSAYAVSGMSDACVSGQSGNVFMSTAPETALNKPDEIQALAIHYVQGLVAIGLSQTQAAGVVGNLMLTSTGLNSGIKADGSIGDAVPGPDGYGIAQWKDARKAGLMKIAIEHKKDPVTQGPIPPSSQCANWLYLTYELANDLPKVIPAVKQTDSLVAALCQFQKEFDPSAGPVSKARLTNAQQVMTWLGVANYVVGPHGDDENDVCKVLFPAPDMPGPNGEQCPAGEHNGVPVTPSDPGNTNPNPNPGSGSNEAPPAGPGTTEAGTTPDSTCNVADFAQQVVAQVNVLRQQGHQCPSGYFPPAGPLKWNVQIFNAAAGHSKDMADNNYFEHNSLDGRSPFDRMTAAGYRFSTAGENIAAGTNMTQVSDAMGAWIDHPGHCENMMGGSFTEIGMACAASGNSTFGHYWTMDLGRP